MKVTTLFTTFRRSAWRRQFADCLIKLRPDMNPDAADELSDVAYQRMPQLGPELAARRYAFSDVEPISPDAEPAANEG